MDCGKDNLDFYHEYNKTLRAWFVGFGFGVPALFIVNDAARRKLMAAESAECIVWLFLLGAAAQVLSAFINKFVSWCAYRKHSCGDTVLCWPVRAGARAENWILIDFAFDLASLVMFVWSISMLVALFLGDSPIADSASTDAVQ